MRRCLVLFAVLAATVVAAPSAGAAPKWQTVPGIAYDFHVGWAAGRAWFIMDDGPSTGEASDHLVVRSARVANGELRSWVTKNVYNADSYLQILGTDLFYSRNDGTLGAVGLQSNGTLGAPSAMAAAEGVGPSGAPFSSAMVRLADRFAWVVENPVTTNTVERLGCCVSGVPVSYSSFLPPSVRTQGYTLARDGLGRLWYAWIQGSRQETGRLKAIELDAVTLEPIGTPQLAPLPPWIYISGTACSNVCYFVTETSRAKATSWRPGETRTTKIPTPTRSTPGYAPADIFATASFNGHLFVGYWADSTEAGVRIFLARGNARGAHPRVLRKLHDPSHIGNSIFAMGTPRGILYPGGLIAVQQYQRFSSGREFLRAAVLRR